MRETMYINYIFYIFSFLLIGSCGKDNNGGKGEDGDKNIAQITYAESASIIPNPERGFIRTFSVKSDGDAVSENNLRYLYDQNITMVLFVFYLDNYKDKELSQSELGIIQNTLNNARNANIKAIVRFAYCDDIGQEDAPLSIVLQHIEQLKTIFENNKDIIAFVQAGFIGPWGEWHSSTNNLTTVQNEQAVMQKLLSVLPQSLMVQVRTPKIKQDIFETQTPVSESMAFTNEPRARVGHHNDCFLTGGDEYGTYTGDIENEKKYISDEALYVPVGGETCPPQNYEPTCVDSRTQMKLLRWTYLNLDWYKPTIDQWRSSGCFDEFSKNLGYRIVANSASLPKVVTAGADAAIEIEFVNRGYASVYHKKQSEIILKNKTTGELSSVSIPLDVRKIKPATTYEFKSSISTRNLPTGNYELFLRISDDDAALKDKYQYSIQLANTNVWVAENGGLNNLNHTIQIK